MPKWARLAAMVLEGKGTVAMLMGWMDTTSKVKDTLIMLIIHTQMNAIIQIRSFSVTCRLLAVLSPRNGRDKILTSAVIGW